MIAITQLHHASLLIRDLSTSLQFYCGVLGLQLDHNRPELGYPGAWLRIGAQQQIHLLQLPNPDPVEGRPAHGGHDRHIALHVESLSPLQLALDKAGVGYRLSSSGRAALFCRDPDGNALEFIARG